jgi:hypothetical protein
VNASHPIVLSLVTSLFMIASGVLDSLAFTYSAGIWREGKLIWSEAAKAGLAFSLGITMYWGGLRYLAAFGVSMPEIQTLLWFATTIIGVTVLGGRFLQWPALDQFIAINGLASLGWLIVRTST